MMEIRNEIKIKVFAQYFGQKLGRHGCIDNSVLDIAEFDYIQRHNILSEVFLILKPLSAITEEHIKELFKAISYGFMQTKFIVEVLEALPYKKAIIAYQFLISKGYDLPNYLLNNKTLQESGLAIYK